jgi:hypothetical protein
MTVVLREQLDYPDAPSWYAYQREVKNAISLNLLRHFQRVLLPIAPVTRIFSELPIHWHLDHWLGTVGGSPCREWEELEKLRDNMLSNMDD